MDKWSKEKSIKFRDKDKEENIYMLWLTEF